MASLFARVNDWELAFQICKLSSLLLIMSLSNSVSVHVFLATLGASLLQVHDDDCEIDWLLNCTIFYHIRPPGPIWFLFRDGDF